MKNLISLVLSLCFFTTVKADDFYLYTILDDDSGFKVSLSEGFKTALNNNSTFTSDNGDSWTFGTAIPAPFSTYKNLPVTSYSGLFAECYGVKTLDLSNFITDKVTDMSQMFDMSGYNKNPQLVALDLSNFDTSNVSDMSYMFAGCSSLKLLDISSFNTSNVTTMRMMFGTSSLGDTWGCRELTSLDLKNFDTSKVTDLSGMFFNCASLKEIDLSNFNTSNVTTIESMFSGCSSLISIDLSNFDTSNMTSFACLFRECSKLETLSLRKFVTSNVIDMQQMFSNCYNLTSLDLSSFDTSNVVNMGSMFLYCYNLAALDISNFTLSSIGSRVNGLDQLMRGVGQNVPGKAVGYVKDSEIIEMFKKYSLYIPEYSFITLKVIGTSKDFYDYILINQSESYKASLSTDYERALVFNNTFTCENYTWEPGSPIPSPKQTYNNQPVTSYASLFKTCGANISAIDLSEFVSEGVDNLDSLFYGCSNLKSIDLSSFDMSNIETKIFMFSGTSSSVNGVAIGYAKDEESIMLLEDAITDIDTNVLKFYIKGSIPPITPIMVSSISLDKTIVNGKIGETIQLTATVLPANATNLAVVWTSDNEAVAAVSENGLVTLIAEGVANITATAADDSGVSATCEITVKEELGVETITVDARIKVENGEIVVSSIAGDAIIEVYNIDGQLVYAGSDRRIALAAHNVYFVKVENKVYKVIL